MAAASSPRPLRPTPIVVDVTNHAGTIDTSLDRSAVDVVQHESLALPRRSIPASRTLRRKKDISIKRYSAPPASPLLDRVVLEEYIPSTPPLTADSGSSGFDPSEVHSSSIDLAPHHYRTQSQPTPSVKIGHPNRPYYSVIRPRPASLISLSPSMTSTTIPAISVITSPLVDVTPTPDPSHSRFRRSSVFLDVQFEANGDVILPTPSALSPPLSLSDGPTHLPFAVLVPLITEAERKEHPDHANPLIVVQKTDKPLLKRVGKGLRKMLSFHHRRP